MEKLLPEGRTPRSAVPAGPEGLHVRGRACLVPRENASLRDYEAMLASTELSHVTV